MWTWKQQTHDRHKDSEEGRGLGQAQRRTLGSRNLPVSMHKHQVNNSIQETGSSVGERFGEGHHDKDRGVEI